MKIEYFPETDSLYIDLAEKVATDAIELSEGIVLDLDEQGRVVGLDIDQASKHLDLRRLNLKCLPFEVEQVA
ncbi:MAG: hypothetical protein RLZ22_1057 [Verrucomicrobiota bacterium]|jgi:uncharacterized protein YuzE